MKRVSLVLTLAIAAGLAAGPAAAQTLKTIKDRGTLSCGVSQGLPGFSTPDDKGNWTGLDVDICRAIAQPRLDAVARHRARRQLHRRDLLLRAGLSGEEVAEGQLRARALQRLRLRADGHHDRAESRRLLQGQQHEVRG